MSIMDKKIALIDDDESFLRIYSQILKENGYDVYTASGGQEGIELVMKNNFPVVITDMVMPFVDGMKVLKTVKEWNSRIQVIVLTAEGSIPNAVEAIRHGAFNYITKPVDIEELILLIDRTYQFYITNDENANLKERIREIQGENQLLGKSQAIEDIRESIEDIASTSASVLIMGESGTGKEVIANLIHYKSQRSKKAFIKVNCASFAETLLESEFFGHEKGSFTNAISMKKGRFELADEGTLFLDEIGELSLNTQSKLLRVLQEKEFERVGGTTPIKTDFRLICATNKNLLDEVNKGNFREDLYYRISVVPINIPPLRERKEDIPVLLDYFLSFYIKEMSGKNVVLEKEALHILMNYDWPGNVRELKNIVERMLVFVKDRPIKVSDLPEEIRRNSHSMDSKPIILQQARIAFEKEFISNALERNNGNVTLTAKEIGIARKNLQIKMKEYGLRKAATQR